MAAARAPEARFVVGASGRVEEANDAALRLLGVTLSELRSASPGTYAAPADSADVEAMRAAWVEAGAIGATGASTIRRADGRLVRVRYVSTMLSDGRFVVAMLPADGLPDSPATVYTTTGEVLAAWRAAERRLEALEPGGDEWLQVQADIGHFRGEYRRLFEARARPRPGD